MKKYYQSKENGYIVKNRRELVRSFLVDLFKFHTLSLHWETIYLPE